MSRFMIVTCLDIKPKWRGILMQIRFYNYLGVYQINVKLLVACTVDSFALVARYRKITD